MRGTSETTTSVFSREYEDVLRKRKKKENKRGSQQQKLPAAGFGVLSMFISCPRSFTPSLPHKGGAFRSPILLSKLKSKGERACVFLRQSRQMAAGDYLYDVCDPEYQGRERSNKHAGYFCKRSIYLAFVIPQSNRSTNPVGKMPGESGVMKKFYQVFYYFKSGKREKLNHIFVLAQNQKEACRECKRVVMVKTGKNAFRPTCNPKDVETVK